MKGKGIHSTVSSSSFGVWLNGSDRVMDIEQYDGGRRRFPIPFSWNYFALSLIVISLVILPSMILIHVHCHQNTRRELQVEYNKRNNWMATELVFCFAFLGSVKVSDFVCDLRLRLLSVPHMSLSIWPRKKRIHMVRDSGNAMEWNVFKWTNFDCPPTINLFIGFLVEESFAVMHKDSTQGMSIVLVEWRKGIRTGAVHWQCVMVTVHDLVNGNLFCINILVNIMVQSGNCWESYLSLNTLSI